MRFQQQQQQQQPAAGGSKSGGTINGAGSTFAAPIYQQWGATLKSEQGLTVNYQAVGSGQGIAELTSGTVDFAGSDPPMTDDEIKAAAKKGAPLHWPTALGAITISYNLSGVQSGLKLDRSGDRRHVPRQGQDVERPRDRQAQPGREASEHGHHDRPPLGLVRHDQGLHRLPADREPELEEPGRL